MFSVSLETWIDFIIGASEKHADPFLQLRDFYPWELVSISFRMIGLGPSVFLKLFFFGTTSTSEEIYVVFPAILGIFNVFLETTKHFHNKCSLVCPWI